MPLTSKTPASILATHQLDAYIIPKWGPYLGELELPGDKRLEAITGFTGSAGFAVVMPHQTLLIVDGRYTQQAPQEAKPGVVAVLGSLSTIPKLIQDALPSCNRVGFCENHFSHKHVAFFKKAFEHNTLQGFSTCLFENTGSDTTLGQKKSQPSEIIPVPNQVSGAATGEKLAQIFKQIEQEHLLIHDPEELCWLLNIRGHDAPTLPIKFGRGLISKNGEIHFYLEYSAPLPPTLIGPNLHQLSEESFWQQAYEKLNVAVSSEAPAGLINKLRTPHLLATSPIAKLKAHKTGGEMSALKEAQYSDNICFIKLFAWLHTQKYQVREMDVVEQLETLRRQNKTYHSQSFETIAGSGPNGAIVHYRPMPNETLLCEHALFLLDAGGHFRFGTTDTTRTLCTTNTPTHEQKEMYTRVLKGHLRVLNTPFPAGTTGRQLDVMARQDLWTVEKDYAHGTGHGVGAMLNVHEGPYGISPRAAELPLAPGVVLTVEPGYYKPGHYGIRIENMAVVEEREPGWLQLRNITHVPYERKLIDGRLLSTHERDIINTYHCHIYQQMAPHLTLHEAKWLAEATAAL